MANTKYYGYVYITTNLINGKKYIGLHKATKHQPYYLGSGALLKKAVTKYGRENFSNQVIKWGKSRQDLNEIEIELIQSFDASEDENFYNLAKGGEGAVHSDATKARLSKIRKGTRIGKDNPFYGKTHTEESKEKMRASKKPMSDEERERRSKAYTGKKRSDEVRKKITIAQSHGTYVTPWGEFITSKEAAKNRQVSSETIRNWCNNPDKKVTRQMYNCSPELKSIGEVVIDQTLRSIGFNLIKTNI